MIEHLASDLVRISGELFARRGYVATSTREIARAVRVDVATVYYHFKTKDVLLSAVLAPLLAAVAVAVKEAKAESDPATRRRELVSALLVAQVDHHNASAVMSDPSVRTVPKVAARLDRVDREVVSALADTIKQPDSRTTARAALAAVRSYTPDTLKSDADRKRAQHAVLRLLGT